MPTPRAGESRDDWMERCVPVVLEDGTADNPDQAVAVCASMWRNRNRNDHPAGGRKEGMTKEHKTLLVKQMDDAGKGTAVFATFGVKDLDGDVTEPGAFGEQDVMVLPTHDRSAVPLGKGVTREEGDRAVVDFSLNLDTAAGREWHSALKFDLSNGRPIQEWSYGFTIEEADRKLVEGEELRVLKRLKVHEVSPVVLGAGMGTRTLALKTAIEDGKIPRERIRELVKSIEQAVSEKGNGRRFADQVEDAIAEIDDVIQRASEIRTERQKDGRDISAERLEQLQTLKGRLEALAGKAAEIGEMLTEQDPAAESLEAINLMAEVEATRRKVFGTR